jgi:dolichol-phosphate mannosyltransferase
MQINKLSIIIPCYNEEPTISQVVDAVMQLKLAVATEVIVIDDGSFDKTPTILNQLKLKHPSLEVLTQEQNKGKTAAIVEGLKVATGDYMIIQDADLEYDPQDIPAIVSQLKSGETSVVYGSRNINRERNNYHYLAFYLGGILITKVYNFLYWKKLTDIATGYKLVSTSLARNLNLHESGFGFCAEITAKLTRRGQEIIDVPITYKPRTFAEGKKINYKDGLQAIWILLKYRLGF